MASRFSDFFPSNYFKLFSLVSELLTQSQIASRGEICPIQELNESLRVNLFFPCCWGFYGPQPPALPQSCVELQAWLLMPSIPASAQVLCSWRCVWTGWPRTSRARDMLSLKLSFDRTQRCLTLLCRFFGNRSPV